MSIKRIVKFLSAEQALDRITGKKNKEEIAAANPLPAEPKYSKEPPPLKDGASVEEIQAHSTRMDAWREEVETLKTAHEEACALISEKRERELTAAMDKVTLTQEEGHPELPEDYVVRDRTEGRCRVVGCSKSARTPSKIPMLDAKRNRWATAFCEGHLHLRRQIPRSDFFALRGSADKGLVV